MVWPSLTFSASPPASSPVTLLQHKTAYDCSCSWEVIRLLFAPFAENNLLASPSLSLSPSHSFLKPLKPEVQCHLLPGTIPVPLLTLRLSYYPSSCFPNTLGKFYCNTYILLCNKSIMYVLPAAAFSKATSSM